MANNKLYPRLKLTSVFRFGKYKGKLCSDILSQDCKYIQWIEDNTMIVLDKELKIMLEKEISKSKKKELERYQDSQRTEVSV